MFHGCEESHVWEIKQLYLGQRSDLYNVIAEVMMMMMTMMMMNISRRVGVLPRGAASEWPNRDRAAAATDSRAGLSALDLGVWWGWGPPPLGPPHLDPAKGQGFSCLRPVQTRVIKGDTLFNSSVTGLVSFFLFFFFSYTFQCVMF